MVEALFRTIYGPIYRQRNRLEIYVILIPMILLGIYYTLVATDRYYSESKVVVQRSGDLASQLGGITLPFLGAVGSSGKEDALHLIEFIHSQDMFERLDKQFALRNELDAGGLDVPNHAMPWATHEDMLALYRKRVVATFDERNGVLTVRTQFNTPERTREINRAILTESENFINELSRQIAREQVTFANQELMSARTALDEAKERLLAFQNKNGVVDPAATLEASARVVAELEAQLAAKQVELNTMSAMLHDNAAQVVSLRQTIASLRQQIDVERKRLASAKGTGLNRLVARYLDQKTMVDFQADVYKISLAATEKMRIEAARKVKSLSVIASPQLPDAAEYPRRAPAVLLGWLLGLIVLYGLVRLAIEIVEDHRD